MRIDHIFFLFIRYIKYEISFLRIIIIRKVVNLILDKIIEKHKTYLRKTKTKFIDKLKPKVSKKKFFIIYCSKESIADIPTKIVNIIIDFLMFMHDFTSSKIHLNIEGKELEENIYNIIIMGKPEDSTSSKNTIHSLKADDLANYLFNSPDISMIANKMINNLKKEENSI